MTTMEKLPEKQECKLANPILQNNSMNTFCKAEIQLIGILKGPLHHLYDNNFCQSGPQHQWIPFL